MTTWRRPALHLVLDLEAAPIVRLVADSAESEAELRDWLGEAEVQARLAAALLDAFEALEEAE